jgi:hypothetical protein
MEKEFPDSTATKGQVMALTPFLIIGEMERVMKSKVDQLFLCKP